MSGEDTEIEGLARPLPGASIGFLKQEPELEGLTVADAIEPALAKARRTLEAFGELSAKLGENEYGVGWRGFARFPFWPLCS
jgi:ATPase subunit of ABC transporter with duplicated ATPase domains